MTRGGITNDATASARVTRLLRRLATARAPTAKGQRCREHHREHGPEDEVDRPDDIQSHATLLSRLYGRIEI
jgi:hypothetical protein